MAVSTTKRKPPPLEVQERILLEQGGLCFYCDIAFDTPVYRNGKLVRRFTCWDHFVPFLYGQHNEAENFVAACSVCNSIKADFMFNTSDECRTYIALRWSQKGFTTAKPDCELRALRDIVPS